MYFGIAWYLELEVGAGYVIYPDLGVARILVITLDPRLDYGGAVCPPEQGSSAPTASARAFGQAGGQHLSRVDRQNALRKRAPIQAVEAVHEACLRSDP